MVYRILNSSLRSLWSKLYIIQCVLSHYLLPFKSQWYQAHLQTINYNVLLTGISESENKISHPACFTHNNFITFQAQCYKQVLNKLINILRQSENFGNQVSSGYQNLPSIAVKKKTFCLHIWEIPDSNSAHRHVMLMEGLVLRYQSLQSNKRRVSQISIHVTASVSRGWTACTVKNETGHLPLPFYHTFHNMFIQADY